MSQPFHIFRVESDGTLRLLEPADNLERAKTRVKKLAAFSPGEYIISNQETGEKISMKSPVKQIVFQIGYEEKDLKARRGATGSCKKSLQEGL